MNAEKLKRLQAQVRIGGKGSQRRKKKVVHQTAATDDKKLQSSLKKLSVSTIPGIEEVNIIKDDLTVIHFNNPKAQASLSANTFAVTGHGETKKIVEMLPEILPQLGQDTVVQLRMFANSMSTGGQKPGKTSGLDVNGDNILYNANDEDDVPMLVSDFDEIAKLEASKGHGKNRNEQQKARPVSQEQAQLKLNDFNSDDKVVVEDAVTKGDQLVNLNIGAEIGASIKPNDKGTASDAKKSKQQNKQGKQAASKQGEKTKKNPKENKKKDKNAEILTKEKPDNKKQVRQEQAAQGKSNLKDVKEGKSTNAQENVTSNTQPSKHHEDEQRISKVAVDKNVPTNEPKSMAPVPMPEKINESVQQKDNEKEQGKTANTAGNLKLQKPNDKPPKVTHNKEMPEQQEPVLSKPQQLLGGQKVKNLSKQNLEENKATPAGELPTPLPLVKPKEAPVEESRDKQVGKTQIQSSETVKALEVADSIPPLNTVIQQVSAAKTESKTEGTKEQKLDQSKLLTGADLKAPSKGGEGRSAKIDEVKVQTVEKTKPPKVEEAGKILKEGVTIKTQLPVVEAVKAAKLEVKTSKEEKVESTIATIVEPMKETLKREEVKQVAIEENQPAKLDEITKPDDARINAQKMVDTPAGKLEENRTSNAEVSKPKTEGTKPVNFQTIQPPVLEETKCQQLQEIQPALVQEAKTPATPTESKAVPILKKPETVDEIKPVKTEPIQQQMNICKPTGDSGDGTVISQVLNQLAGVQPQKPHELASGEPLNLPIADRIETPQTTIAAGGSKVLVEAVCEGKGDTPLAKQLNLEQAKNLAKVHCKQVESQPNQHDPKSLSASSSKAASLPTKEAKTRADTPIGKSADTASKLKKLVEPKQASAAKNEKNKKPTESTTAEECGSTIAVAGKNSEIKVSDSKPKESKDDKKVEKSDDKSTLPTVGTEKTESRTGPPTSPPKKSPPKQTMKKPSPQKEISKQPSSPVKTTQGDSKKLDTSKKQTPTKIGQQSASKTPPLPTTTQAATKPASPKTQQQTAKSASGTAKVADKPTVAATPKPTAAITAVPVAAPAPSASGGQSPQPQAKKAPSSALNVQSAGSAATTNESRKKSKTPPKQQQVEVSQNKPAAVGKSAPQTKPSGTTGKAAPVTAKSPESAAPK